MDKQQEEHESHMRRTKILSFIIGVLVMLFATAAWFSYPAFRDQKKAVADTVGLQSATNTLGARVGSVEGDLKKITSGLPSLSDRMSQIEASMKTNLQQARTQAQAAANRIRDDVNQSIRAIQSRLPGVESNQRESSERVNQSQDQIAGLQKELSTMREEASTANARIKELTDAQQSSKTCPG